MTRDTWRCLLSAIALVAIAAGPAAQTPSEKTLEIRPSRIPHAGNGVFAKVAIPNGAYLGAYTGEFITEAEYQRRAAANKWQYMMGLLDCARAHTGGLTTIDGITGNVFTRMNYAPAEFQNVKFQKICEAPFVKIVALRDIAAGEELWVDYGPRYRYDFMEDPAVIAFFAGLRAERSKKETRDERLGTSKLPAGTPMTRITASQPVSMDQVRVLARGRFGDMVKGVVDLRRGVLLLDADMHADQEAELLAEGSAQVDLWGINLYPDAGESDWLEFDSMINLRPSFGNRSRGVDDPATRAAIADLVGRLVHR